MWILGLNGKIQSNPVNTDIEGVIERSVKKHLFILKQNTKEIKEDISIVKLNISNLHKAIIP